MLRLIPAPAAAHFTNLERGGSALPETLNLLIMAYWLNTIILFLVLPVFEYGVLYSTVFIRRWI